MTADILLVDDNAVQAATRKAILTRTGSSVVIATGPRQALEYLRDGELLQTLGLVITDHVMPFMNGAQFVTELRRFYPKLPVLVLSGLPGIEHEYEGLNVIHRMKPLSPEDLLQLTQDNLQKPLRRTA